MADPATGEPAPRDERRRALVISSDPVGREMRGMSPRYTEFARALAAAMEVTLMAPELDGTRPVPEIEYESYEPGSSRAIERAAAEHHVVVAPPQPPGLTRHLQRAGVRLILDLYAPEHFEALESMAGRPSRLAGYRSSLVLDRMNAALAWADVLLCGTERHRDLWLGAMLSAGLIDLRTYQRDPTYERVLPIVPWGLAETPPKRVEGLGLRDRFPTIGSETKVVLWNGGVWNWLDPEVAIAAIEILLRRGHDVALVFMSASPEAVGRIADMARGRRLLETGVLVNEGRVPYGERATWLLDADCAVAAHRRHLEARFSLRTRLLDCLWTGLPILTTRGDVLSEMIEADDLGVVVDPGDPQQLADAMESVLSRGKADFAERLGRAARRFRWSQVTQPLVTAATADSVPREVHSAPRIETRPGRAARWGADRLVRGVAGRLRR